MSKAPHPSADGRGAKSNREPVEGQTGVTEERRAGGKAPASEEREVEIKGKVLIGALLSVVLVAGLYYADRYWIAPAVKTQAKSEAKHPFAPDFSLTDLSGNKLKLSDYKGKVVLLDFWATWCGPCLIEIPGFVELQNRYGSQGLVIIGISMDDGRGPVVEFYRRYKMNYPVALGDGRVEELYGGIIGLPTAFLIGRDGRIYVEHEGATDPALFEAEIKELLAMEPTAEAWNFQPAAGTHAAVNIELGDPAEVDSEVPGVNLSTLTAAQKEAFKKQLEGRQCTCGCKFNLLKCRQVDRKCAISRRLAREELAKFLKSHAAGTVVPSPARQPQSADPGASPSALRAMGSLGAWDLPICGTLLG